MNNQLKQTPSQDLFDKVFKAIHTELSKAGVEHLSIYPEKIEFRVMKRAFRIEAKEIKGS
jgi:hypothetical protein